MAKPTGIFRLRGSQGDITYVGSKAYGEHTRVRRSRGPVNDVLKAHAKRTSPANKLCKSIKDPFDPFRENFRDGTFWSRLLSLVRTQLARQKAFDWTALGGFEFFQKHKLSSLMTVTITSSLRVGTEKNFAIKVLSYPTDNLQNRKATHVRQSIIALFLDKNSRPTLSTEEEIFAGKSGVYQTQTAQWTLPPNTAIVVVALKCELAKGVETIERAAMKGMQIVLAVDLRSLDKNKKWISNADGKAFNWRNFPLLSEVD